ncbi:DNA-binding MarR family transcriptional regulator [Caulobacter ginsengisoli]|uniref:DNA-binding MarR family transcriptional regulator n=1 Tax=Caulobacter ginsengisoli TaxID=400775 RepID=A0ABU0ITT7_9CAUL|nr:helix-turn-helix domain-containing protein [Caulobacter ginsengisoli]MDQ0465415.1 DNA-binding MarR family transcriptional regulator [Caulobacter ginsengisoli]
MAKTKTGSKHSDGTLDRSPGHLLHRAQQRALDFYAAAGPAGAVTQRQYAVLAAVAAREGAAQAELVAATGIDRSTLAELVARMIGKDLLARERSKADARANAVHLTEAGRAALDAAAPQATAADAQLLALLPRGKRDVFVDLLRLLTGDEARPEKVKKDKAEKAERKAAKAEKKKKKAAKTVKEAVE